MLVILAGVVMDGMFVIFSAKVVVLAIDGIARTITMTFVSPALRQ